MKKSISIKSVKKQLGVTAVEYAILAAALAATLFLAVGPDGPLQDALNTSFEKVKETITEGSE